MWSSLGNPQVRRGFSSIDDAARRDHNVSPPSPRSFCLFVFSSSSSVPFRSFFALSICIHRFLLPSFARRIRGGVPLRSGAHLGATAILRQAEWELGGYGLSSPWSPSSLAGFVGVSGVYAPDDRQLVEHFNRKGLYREGKDWVEWARGW